MRIAATVIGVVALSGVASYFGTLRNWDGGFPAGEFRVNVQGPDGKPIEGAALRIYHGGTRDLAFNYPLDNHVDGKGIISDENGRITAIRREGGLQFGGNKRYLFWMMEIKDKGPPQYDGEITAEGFQPLKFRINELFKSPHRFYEEFPKTQRDVDGNKIELPNYEHAYTLKRTGSTR